VAINTKEVPKKRRGFASFSDDNTRSFAKTGSGQTQGNS